MKILIVEDETKTGDYLKQGLAEAGFSVDLVRNGLDGMHEGLVGAYDLMILAFHDKLLKVLFGSHKRVAVLFEILF